MIRASTLTTNFSIVKVPMIPSLFSLCLSQKNPSPLSASPGSFTLSSSLLSNLSPIRFSRQEIHNSLDFHKRNLTIDSTLFHHCQESVEGHLHSGGAIDASECIVSITDSDFERCLADFGGATSFSDSDVTILRTNFTLNTAAHSGAGVFHGGKVYIKGGFYLENDGWSVGAFSFVWAPGDVNDAFFYLNHAHDSETGGILVRDSPVNFKGGAFVHNHAEHGRAGALAIYDITGTMKFDGTIFVSNEVIGWNEVHVFVSGLETEVVFTNCTFDTVSGSMAIMLEVENGQTPKVDRKKGLRFGVRPEFPYHELFPNLSVELKWDFEEGRSNRFAMLIFVAVPLFIGVVAWILTW
jgi:hypothetical protein